MLGDTLYPGGQGLLTVGQKRLTLHSPNPREVLSHSSDSGQSEHLTGARLDEPRLSLCHQASQPTVTQPAWAGLQGPAPFPTRGYLGAAPDPSSPLCNSSIEATSAATTVPSTVGPSISPPAAPLPQNHKHKLVLVFSNSAAKKQFRENLTGFRVYPFCPLWFCLLWCKSPFIKWCIWLLL